jgi:ABC-2 type transport system permease protein
VRAARLRDGTVAMGWAELRKLRHDHLDIFTRSVQPLLWLFVFGTALRTTRLSPAAPTTTARTSRPA